MVARWKPVHLGHVAVLEALLERADEVVIGWRDLVPPAVADLIDERGLAARFRREFGLATLALDSPSPMD